MILNLTNVDEYGLINQKSIQGMDVHYVCPVCKSKLKHEWLSDNVYMIGCLTRGCGVNPISYGRTKEEAIIDFDSRAIDIERTMKTMFRRYVASQGT